VKISEIRGLIDKIEKKQLDSKFLFSFGQEKIQFLESKIADLKDSNKSLL
jgi:hypothetical protein